MTREQAPSIVQGGGKRGGRMACGQTSGLRAQSTMCGYLLYRCVHHAGQRRERRRTPHALGYTLSASHSLVH